jgi:prolyl oligopeptidase
MMSIMRPTGFLRMALTIAALVPTLAIGASIDYPPAPKRPATETLHGVTIVDDYRWLEDNNAADVREWVRAENALTRRILDAVPQRAEIVRRVEELMRSRQATRGSLQYRGGRVFAIKYAPPKNQPMLVVLPASLDVAQERVVLDPTALDATGHTAIDFYAASYDGRYVAVSLSQRGSERGTARVYEVDSGRELPDVVPRVKGPTAGGSIEWAADSRGFYYTRYPADNERPAADRAFYQTVWFHTLGAETGSDRFVLGRGFPRIAEISLHGGRDGRSLLAAVKNGDGGEIAWHVLAPGRPWRQVAGFRDGVKQMELGADGRLYARSMRGALRGRILVLPATEPSIAKAKVVVPEGELAADDLHVGRDRLFVRYRDGGPTRIAMFGLDGAPLGELPVEPLSNNSVVCLLDGDDAIVRTTSFVTPPTAFVFRADSGRLVQAELDQRPPFNFDDAVVERGFATSKDGTRVPVTVLRLRSAKLDGSNPALLNGYGGYGISIGPNFRALNRLWLDLGGIYAVAGIRGGGEYGEAWHQAGMLTRKQNVFDDFAAAMQYLVDRGYTRPDKLAIEGGSNGGLTMGAALTQHPKAMRAVVSHVGIYDPLHWETQDNGVFNATEFGSVRNPEQFRAMLDYSPLRRATDGTDYPAVLLTSGDNDGRVAPYESRKFAARLQASTRSGNPVLLRTESAAGHGQGSSLDQRVQQSADVYTFLVDQLGIPVPPKSTQ